MSLLDIVLIVVAIVSAVVFGLYFLNKKLTKKATASQDMIERSKQVTTIFVIDKKKDKITNINVPKAVIDGMPKMYKLLRLHFVQAKIGAQIITLMCDKHIFNAIPTKRNVKVEVAGIYIVNVVGMKTKEELKQAQKDKKIKMKNEKKAKKDK